MRFENLLRFGASALLLTSGLCESIAKINGNRFLSPFRNQSVSNVTGIVTAVGPNGFWIRSTKPDHNALTSNSVYVFTSGKVNATVGNKLRLNGEVSEYRSNAAYLFLTEITNPTNVTVLSKSRKAIEPIALGQPSTSPPTSQYTSLDNGSPFNLPNNVSLISAVNPVLQPSKYGLDFWESLSGELVLVSSPRAITKPTNSFEDTWVVGNWTATSVNSRGGLTVTSTDFNPEAILIGSPLDGSKNPSDTKLGDELEDIVGVISQAFGYYRILPLTKISVTSSATPALPPSASFASSSTCSGITLGQYNIENFAPNSTSLEARADHIVKYLNSPDLVFLQEIQDDTGPTDDGVVASGKTLSVLTTAIVDAGGPEYNFTYISPVNDQDGGQPGGNIRVAYLYKPDLLTLHDPNPGTSTDAIEVTAGPGLSFNPGRIAPGDSAWDASRKPLVAQWDILAPSNSSSNTTSTFFTINVHFTSKGGSSSIEGDARPPVNGGVDQRIAQANLTASFVADILAKDPNAKIITAGDFNEFEFVEPIMLFAEQSGLQNMDEVAGVAVEERYTYLFDMNSQELDHMYVSKAVADGDVNFEHVHVNTWVSFADQASDHDPSVAQMNLC